MSKRIDPESAKAIRDALQKAPDGVYDLQDSSNVRSFSSPNLGTALKKCLARGYQALYMPELASAQTNVSKDSELFNNFFSTLSLKATGRTKNGNAVVVYAHAPHYLSDPQNIQDVIRNKRLVYGAAPIPQEELDRLLALEGNGRVFVVDAQECAKWPNGFYGISKPTREHLQIYGGNIDGKEMIARNNPQIKPFLGGGEELVDAYLQYFQKLYEDQIGIWNADDLEDQALGRVLFVNIDNDGLDGDIYLGDIGRFFGVSAGGAQRKNFSTNIIPLEERVEDLGQGRIRFKGRVYNLSE